jgi:dienelactone hydrolase
MFNFGIVSTAARVRAASVLLAVLTVISSRNYSQESTETDQDIQIQKGLVIGSMGRSGRTPFHTDAIEAAIVSGEWEVPHEGDAVKRTDGTNRVWHSASAKSDGTFTNSELRGGYLYAEVVLSSPEVRLLDAAGHNTVYVNGEPRAGDPYSNGILELPVALHKGTNQFLFNVGRGSLRAKLVKPKSPVLISSRDTTLPDIIRGKSGELWGAVVLINGTEKELKDFEIVSSTESGGADRIETALPVIPPMTARKVPFRVRVNGGHLGETNALAVRLELFAKSGESQNEGSSTVSLRIRNPEDHYKETFRSEIDGSIQYYAVDPPKPAPASDTPVALFLSTHGASVEAMGQADAYASKTWGYLVAPTNRRPYGFDWEDWGREDALEVLNLAQAKFQTDPAQTYLTGHSMGGHGAWQLGVTFPGRFAAIAPSAGWISFFSYGGARKSHEPTPVEKLIERATTGSDTLTLASNYLQEAIYILHGDADDNVPVTEARKMKERLSEFHHDFMYHEQPGAGHWWGNLCVDWPPIFNLFAHHKIPADGTIIEINFSTANPGVSATNHWIVIEAQEHPLARSSVDISYDAGARKLHGSTENVQMLRVRTEQFKPSGPVSVELDGDKVELSSTAAESGALLLERESGHWREGSEPKPLWKNPRRYGPFKEAFNHEMVFVYGTHGSVEENAALYAKARYDAETWWYRGNGAVDLIADSEFDSSAEPDRGVVLFGNSENNSAWSSLLGGSPVQVTRASVKIGDREMRGGDLACLFCRPRPGSDIAMVAAVSGTGLPGFRVTERVPYFLSGVEFPDVTLFGSDTLAKGSKAVRAAGFFGNDWSIEKGEFAWRE